MSSNDDRDGSGGPFDDPAAEPLRRALDAEARRLDPTDPLDSGLTRIRARTDEEVAAGSGLRRWLAPAAVAAAVVTALVVGAAVWPRGAAAPTGPAAQLRSPSPSTSPSPWAVRSPMPTPSSSATPSTGTGATVAVYFGAAYNGRTMLYREFRRTTVDPVTGALQAMLAGPADLDYASLWPAGTTLAGVTRSGGVVTVTLSRPPTVVAPPLGTYGASSVQEVVYTVTAADPSVREVTVRYPGGHSTAARAPSVNVLASVWLLSPTQGGSQTSPVTLAGTASVFEGTVSWQVTQPDGSVVAQGTAMASIGAPGRGTWSTTVTLPPGSYLAKAYAVSAQDGSATWPDSKAFTVR
jgi:Immunoglobulin-like domain of bacterial spore germination/Sporulation and spore germination